MNCLERLNKGTIAFADMLSYNFFSKMKIKPI